jgi:hypothetical protein
LSDLTFNEHIAAALEIARHSRAQSMRRAHGGESADLSPEERAEHDAAARELALAITHLEDGNTRYNSARYHQMGRWQRVDPDKL